MLTAKKPSTPLRRRGPAIHRRAYATALCALTLLLTAAAPAVRAESPAALPLTAAAAGPGELPAQLRAALREYTSLLPQARRLRWLEITSDGASRSGSWNPATQSFLQACQRQAEDCAPLLHGQLELLGRTARRLPDGDALAAPLLSAVADLCMSYPSTLQPGRPFEVCGLNLRLGEAALRWQEQGNELLFADYVSRYDVERNQYLGWLQSRGQTPDAGTLAALPELPPWLRAQEAEAAGYLALARWSWFTAYWQAAAPGAKPGMEGLIAPALLQMARLSWRLGDGDFARALEGLYRQRFGAGGARGCVSEALSWRLDIARAAAEESDVLADAGARMQALQRGNCAYTQAVFELASDSLVRADTLSAESGRELARLLERSLQACASPGAGCAAYRLPQLQGLLQLLQGRPAQQATLLRAYRELLSQAQNVLPDSELRLAWAAGAISLQRPAQRQAALQLLLDAQEHLMNRASATQAAAQAEQQNLSRFDGLHRLVARAAVQQGQQLAAVRTETLRAQTLLRRLRLQRLQTELAGQHDAAADARYQDMLTQMEQLRRLGEAAWGGADGPVFAAFVRRSADDSMAMADLQRLEALAAKRLESQGRRGDWLSRALGFSALMQLEDSKRNWLATEADSLAAEEAYLSWLQVPGGYIATLIGPAAGEPATRASSNHWIPFGAPQQATLKLYRELLRSGAARPTATAGLSLRGRPVWRRPDGSHVAASEPPPGARQVRQVEDIARELYSALLAPLPPQWLQARRLLISPDGALSQLPFETLWREEQPLPALLDIGYVQSLAVHAELTQRAAARREGPPRLLSLADPSYALPPAPAGTRAPPDWMAELDWQALPGTRRESDLLMPLFARGRQILGAQASQRSLLELQQRRQLADYRVLHFATHGYVDDERSALVLSMGEGLEQAYLQDGSIAQLTLRSDLVLLSACDTGLGRNQSGEGVMGLPYAFMLAGNTDTLMSLWAVDDRGTAAFMPVFMAKARAGQDVVTALNATKREFMAGQHGEAMRDPRIWAAFVLYGVPLRIDDADSAENRRP